MNKTDIEFGSCMLVAMRQCFHYMPTVTGSNEKYVYFTCHITLIVSHPLSDQLWINNKHVFPVTINSAARLKNQQAIFPVTTNFAAWLKIQAMKHCGPYWPPSMVSWRHLTVNSALCITTLTSWAVQFYLGFCSAWIIFGQTKTCYMIIMQIYMASETVVSYWIIRYIASSFQWHFSDIQASEACVQNNPRNKSYSHT